MADEGKEFLNPDEIDALLNANREEAANPPEPPATADPAAQDPKNVDEEFLDPADIDALLQKRDGGQPSQPAETAPPIGSEGPDQILEEAQAQLGEAMAGIPMPDPTAKFGAPAPYPFQLLEGGQRPKRARQPLEILQDVELDLRIELGRTEMLIEEVVALKEGSVVTLDKLAGDPVDILVNGRLIARGEVLVLNDNFCVRVAEILTPDE